ncbi:MAG TPA: serine/threonine-protein kinase, partial [Thermoanaerobaculia bacterium]|nr:serine/threonine-protein kinase [Thermoanaerobaculia bacterium]
MKPGLRLGPYEILSPLGKGGMGEVWRAKDTRLNRDVAVKVLPEDFLEGEERKQRFEREARLLAALNHPGIAAIYSFEEIPGSSPVLVMELVEGETLAARLERGPLPLERALRVGAEIADALAAAHRGGIVHRDLKPSNVMITKSGVKVLDFGLARSVAAAGEPLSRLETEAPPLTETGAVVGTLPYMAPEQLEGKATDARTDVFALGAVLYETLTGRRPFRAESRAALAVEILTARPPDVSSVGRGIPPGLDRIVAACLAKDPD